jgi:dienelactone hydrolase
LGGTRELSFGPSTADENLWIVTSYSDVDPGTVWLYNRKTKNLSTLYQVREKLPREALAQMTPIRYKSSDGLEIPAYLTLPKGVEAKNLPLVVFPHGGPWARDSWGYSSYAQFLANRGYAVLQMNFRGSTGYGKKFLDAGNKQWGNLMQDDITWGVKHLVSQGIADPKRVGIMGGSYGGYATLAGVAFTPDIYAAAVAIVAPSNLQTLLESIPPYWEPIRIMFYERMGNPNNKEELEKMKRQSPLFSADKIKTPLFVVQGANDPRVTKRESDQIVIALRDRNFPVEYMVAPDEGHGFARPVNNMAMLAKAEKFLAQYLGGRFQESMPTDVAQRLSEIMVDVKTVKLEQKPDMTAKAEADVSGKWKMLADAGGQMIQIDLDLKQNEADFDGKMNSILGGGTVENGKVSGTNFTADAKLEVQGQAMVLKMEGKVEGEKMTGTLSGPGLSAITFTATKEK